ncbi:MAG: hypothetical protein M1837_006182 [Sclerophora amabilis]|nr:MAG: hypothetical protein M1837_006182 [Sclerophora amabilis]
MPASIGRVFFSKGVIIPFLKFRMLRHGYLHSPVYWRDIDRDGLKGIWITTDETKEPDIIVYYCHVSYLGGGFSMGSSHFYLEFLLAWVTLLREEGFHNPALFALEYTLVPDAVYPTQLQQTIAGYNHVLSIVGNPSRVCVGGDSAGATLILSLLLHLGNMTDYDQHLPGYATLISPWVTLVSPKNRDTASDYLNADSLHLYARQYVGSKISLNDPIASPGHCTDIDWWQRAMPSNGLSILFGGEEVFGPDTLDLIAMLEKTGAFIDVREERGSIHAWPVARLFLGDSKAERQKGLAEIVEVIHERMG